MTDRVLHLDFETYSTKDLGDVGVENYIRALGFAVTVVAWAFDDSPVVSMVWPHTDLPADIRAHIHAGGTIKAWNASFEWNVLDKHYGVDVAHEQMDCVMQRSLAWGLPARLDRAGDALKLGIVKDAGARALMLRMGRPKADGTAWHYDQSPKAQQMLSDLTAYCRQDVAAERALDKVIPALHPFERKLSVIDAEINDRGVLIDMAAAINLGCAAAHEQGDLKKECMALTNGAVASPGTETVRMLAWLEREGCPLPDLTKETVARALTYPSLTADVQRVLEIRQLAAKSSVAKIVKMVEVASSMDGRARNLLQFYGAGRTGRWAGRLIQVQNLPKPEKGVDPQRVIGLVRTDPKALGLFYARPMTAIASSLRACLVARPGHVLVSIDLSQIEARVLAWLAGQGDVLDVFRRGEDVYAYAAAKVGSGDRQLGKVLTLACGYGMGPGRFMETAASYGVTLGAAQAEAAVDAWRQATTGSAISGGTWRTPRRWRSAT